MEVPYFLYKCYILQPKKVKNVSYDSFGTKEGKVHMKRQDYTKLQTRKMKGLKRKSDTSETQETKNKVKKKNQMDNGV